MLLGLARLPALAQEGAEPSLPIAQVHTLHSDILHQDRTVYVYRPALAFGTQEAGPYPVLFLLDADRQLPLVAGQIDFLSKTNLSMPQMIVVGIDTNHYDRLHDLTPTHSDRADPDSPIDTSPSSPTRTSGGGEAFLRFIDQELAPFIAQRYPVAPYRILAGHSLGGLLVMHALLKHPHQFDAYIAISPSLWWDDESLLRGAAADLRPGRMAGKALFVSIAGEGGTFQDGLRRLDAVLKQHAEAQLQSHYVEYPQQTHASVPAVAFRDSWTFLFPRWLSPVSDRTVAQTEAFYAALSQRYGYDVRAPEGIINARGYQALREQRRDDALGFFRMNVRSYPASANAFDSLGDGYAALGETSLAAACFAQALARDATMAATRGKLEALQAGNNAAQVCR